MDAEKRNLLLAMVASMAILGVYLYFYSPHVDSSGGKEKKEHLSVSQTQTEPVTIIPASTTVSFDEAMKGPRILIETPCVQGSLSLIGARLDDLILLKHSETPDIKSSPVRLLSPSGTTLSYLMESGWIAPSSSLQMPSQTTLWTASGTHLTSKTPITLSWRNPEGIEFQRTFSIDDGYMITVTDVISNQSTLPLRAHPYAAIARTNKDDAGATSYALHEGAVGYLGGKLKEEKYKDIAEEKVFKFDTTGGWLGFTDKYWLTALIPDQQQAVTAHMRWMEGEHKNRYQSDFVGTAIDIQPGTMARSTFRFYAGAKSLEVLDAYESSLGIPHFDLSIDFGWFYFLTKPLFFALQKLHDWLGNFALAIIVLTLLIRAALFPLASKSHHSMAKMKALQPQLDRIKERCGDDKIKLNQEMMTLYKQHKVNPVSGCLPMVLQIPVLFAIYKVLLISIEMRHAPLFGWIRDMSSPDPTTFFNLFGLIPWTPPAFLMIGALPLLMGGTMYLQQKLSPQPTVDPIQSKMMLLMPFIFTYMLAQFPSGVVFYWTLTNILAMAQQWLMMRPPTKDR